MQQRLRRTLIKMKASAMLIFNNKIESNNEIEVGFLYFVFTDEKCK
jgi:hypothetical protein